MKYLLPVVLILLSLFNSAWAEDADTVTLKEKAFLAGEYICLGDIAVIQGPNEKELASLRIMKSPKSTLIPNLSADYIARKIREGHPGWKVVVNGSPSVQLCESLVRISSEELAAIYREAVMKNSPWKDRGNILIKDIRTPPNVSIREKDREDIQAKFSQGEDFLGLTTATISFGMNSSQIFHVSGRVMVTMEIPVVKRTIPRGAVITDADLETKTLDISSSPLIMKDKGECLGMRTKTMIPAGKVILRSNVELPPLVNKGDIVAIQAQSEGLVIEDKGIALKDGYLNEHIPVRNAGSGKQVIGIIIARSLVEVTF